MTATTQHSSLAVTAYLAKDSNKALKDSCRAVFIRDFVAPAFAQHIDSDTHTIHAKAKSLDNQNSFVSVRADQKFASKSVLQALADHRAAIDATVSAAGLARLSKKQILTQITREVTSYIASPAAALIVLSPFPDAWREVAHLLANRACSQTSTESDYEVLSLRTLCAFFTTAGLNSAADVHHVLSNLQAKSPLGYAGGLTRLVSRAELSERDTPPPLASWPAPIALLHASISDLAAAVALEWQAYGKGQGPMSRFLTPARLSTGLAARLPSGFIQKARGVSYRLYDASILGYLATTACEQLLRATAATRGIATSKNNGAPVPVLKWYQQLNFGSDCNQAIEVMYGKHDGLRDRIVHSGLLDVEAKRSEQLHKNVLSQPSANVTRHGPENVASLALLTLMQVDSEIGSSTQVTPRALYQLSRRWVQDKDVVLGRSLVQDFATESGADLLEQVWNFLTAVVPSAANLFRFGFASWLSPITPQWTRISGLTAMVLVTEAIARSALLLANRPVLQRDDNKSRVQYLMLDSRGLLSPAIRAALLDLVPKNQREPARSALAATERIRNAFAHGTAGPFTDARLEAYGNLLFKTAALFIQYAVKHMIRERAYFLWKAGSNDIEGNWVVAEQITLRKLRSRRL